VPELSRPHLKIAISIKAGLAGVDNRFGRLAIIRTETGSQLGAACTALIPKAAC
jgi:hypothetical protein